MKITLIGLLKKTKWNKRARERSKKTRLLILTHYSKGKPICFCCGETEESFLILDHKNGNGTKHRKITGGGTKMYSWILKNNFPDIFQVLCLNCNWGKYKKGICPHKRNIH